MNIYSRVRAINGAALKATPKDVTIAKVRDSLARHFKDSVDYESGTLINGTPQQLIVSKNKSVVTQKKIVAYPGESIPLGAVVDCYNCKWLVTEVDPDREVYVNAVMEQCNRQLTWQNVKTGEIITRWCTMSKPYFSNLDETKRTTLSKREYKLQIPYDDETSLLDVDKRFMLEMIDGEPKTYRITCVDTNTERFEFDGSTQGFLAINIEQDQYNQRKDNKELMICDYVNPDDIGSSAGAPTENDFACRIDATNNGEIKIGGSAKRFKAVFFDADGNDVVAVPKWKVDYIDEFAQFVTVKESGPTLTVKVAANKLMEGSFIRIKLTDEGEACECVRECKVVELI